MRAWNAIRRAPLHLYTALSLDPPAAGKGLEARFLGPFVARHFGDDFPRLAYVQAHESRCAAGAHRGRGVLPAVRRAAALAQAQRRYASLNYTHVAARAGASAASNALVQKVARGR